MGLVYCSGEDCRDHSKSQYSSPKGGAAPRPVIMLSAYTYHGAEKAIIALERGAVDFVQKPGVGNLKDIESIGQELISKVKAIRYAHFARLHSQRPAPKEPLGSAKCQIQTETFLRET